MPNNQVEQSIDPDLAHAMRVSAFTTLHPDAKTPASELPIKGMDVFILDTDPALTRKFVHVAQYCPETNTFDSDGGWFEAIEVELWAYVPGLKHERMRAELAEQKART